MFADFLLVIFSVYLSDGKFFYMVKLRSYGKCEKELTNLAEGFVGLTAAVVANRSVIGIMWRLLFKTTADPNS